MSEKIIGIGVIGCGGFAQFAILNFLEVPGVRLVAVSDSRLDAAQVMANHFGVIAQDIDALVRNSQVNLVYIATPPFLHYPQSMLALRHGKNVICEKPLSLEVEEADEMIALAEEKNLLLVNNLMQRYNPLYWQVNELIQSKVLGEVLHGYFENYASDEKLPPGHWFWDTSKGGGIFIEHGVHFFDLFAGWLGAGKAVGAQRILRPDSLIEEQAQCTVLYPNNILVNFYHGFHQPLRLDRQELRILFERGDITLYEWVPTRALLRATVDNRCLEDLDRIFPNAEVEIKESYLSDTRVARGRHKVIEADQLIHLRYGQNVAKMERYGEMIRAMLADQIRWIHDPKHQRKVTAERARNSVAIAVEATRLADEFESVAPVR